MEPRVLISFRPTTEERPFAKVSRETAPYQYSALFAQIHRRQIARGVEV